jgi:hypothetical protein
MKNQPFFARRGDAFIPNPVSNGPWNPDSMHGRIVIGLLAHVIEEQHGSAEGVAIGECWLYDEKGPIGTSTVAALAQRKPMTNVPPP